MTEPTVEQIGRALLAYDSVIGDSLPVLALRYEAMRAALKAALNDKGEPQDDVQS